MTEARRDYSIDWLRALATLNIFLFHSARLFNHEDWHVKNNDYWAPATVFIMISCQYIMPLFFLLSAYGSTQSLSRRKSGEYLKERFNRLMVPLIFGALVVIAPIQVWIERVTHPPFYPESFIHFMLHDYFHGFYAFGGNFAWIGLHLWYLLYLFVFSLLTLPLFRFLLRDRPRDLVGRLAEISEKPLGLLIWVLPVFLAEALANLQPDGIGTTQAGGWNVLSYLAFFVTGFIMLMDPKPRKAMAKQRWWWLAVAAVFISIMLYRDLPRNLHPGFGDGGFQPSISLYLFLCFGKALLSYSCLFTIIGFGHRHLNLSNPRLPWINSLLLPFYILHQTVIVCIGHLIRDVAVSPALKYSFVLLTAFPVIIITFEIVRRFKLTRFLFGMKA